MLLSESYKIVYSNALYEGLEMKTGAKSAMPRSATTSKYFDTISMLTGSAHP